MAIILDLAAALEMDSTYDSLVNDVMAVRIFPCEVEAEVGTGFYQENMGDVFVEPWIRYDGSYSEQPRWQCSGPQRRAALPHLMTLERPWDLLALSSVLRDRWFPSAWRSSVNLD